jgi:hypothetical protein
LANIILRVYSGAAVEPAEGAPAYGRDPLLLSCSREFIRSFSQRFLVKMAVKIFGDFIAIARGLFEIFAIKDGAGLDVPGLNARQSREDGRRSSFHC